MKRHAECYDYIFDTIIKLKKFNIGENIIYNTKYFNKLPIILNNNVINSNYNSNKSTIDDFYVWDHPWLPKNSIMNANNENKKIPMLKSLIWNEKTKSLFLINQRKLPKKLETLECKTYKEVANSIKNMTVRGAPAIGVSGAFGMVLGSIEYINNANNNNNNVSINNFLNFMKSYVFAIGFVL